MLGELVSTTLYNSTVYHTPPSGSKPTLSTDPPPMQRPVQPIIRLEKPAATPPYPIPTPGGPQYVARQGPSSKPLMPDYGESINLGGIVASPYDYIRRQDETQKELMDLVQSAMGADMEVDMEKAHVEGFAKGIVLLPHQVQGRVWMAERESGKKAGGILSDMGLGKTIQTLARIMDYKMSEDEAIVQERKKWGKTTLIVVPNSVIGQWESEAKKMAPSLRVLVHANTDRTKDASRFKNYDIVITSYNTVGSEYKNSLEGTDKGKGKENNDDNSDNEEFEKAVKMVRNKQRTAKKHQALLDMVWLRIVLGTLDDPHVGRYLSRVPAPDEAHNIKNRNAQMSKGCYGLKAKYRWCLTGTPIQNGVEELFSLIHFLQIRPLNDWDTFNTQIAKPIKAGKSGVPMKRLQVVLQAIMLRRTKTQIVQGKPIISLPDRLLDVVSCEFDEEEAEFYKALTDRTNSALDKIVGQGKLNSFMGVLLLLLRLRQACCHPQLCTKNARVDADAIDPKAKANTKDEVDEADDLAGMLERLEVRENKCEMCQEVLRPGVKGQFCPDCEVQVVVKAKAKGPSTDDGEPQQLSSSTKIRKLLELLEKVDKDSEGKDKVIVFSQFTTFLDVIQTFLREEGYKYVRYDGSMKREEREAALDKFRTSSRYNVALISFKAGSTGLNLTAANHVILMDLWWNPALEDQAYDRAHRLGQTKTVYIYKLIVPDTVEQRIQELQDKKRELATNALTGDKLGKRSKLGMDELMTLFANHH
ncbi:hypothetical protein FRB99_007049 [Tulasnella sp. 403]|nr:hypothetical protein FRB99_007049 [Tulasnella sp. 403]